MNAPVEAQSLSALTNLFANPPQYPRNPTHEVREPLVLYIVRVPGSKDVFLTPLKPPTKASISLEAIQSSLYYLHVANEKDEEVKRSIDEERRSEEAERQNPPIHRKPLPPVPHANYPPSERPLPPPKSYPSYQPGLGHGTNASQAERYAARGSHLRFSNEAEGQRNHRKPPSPRRLQQISPLADTNQLSTDPFRAVSSQSESQTPYWHQVPDEIRRAGPEGRQSPFEENVAFHETYSYHSPPPKSSADVKGPKLVSNACGFPAITLIRRDPVSGGQWNVGSITLGQAGLSSAQLVPVSVEITTPGYGRFTALPELSRPGTAMSDAGSIKGALANGRFGPLDPNGANYGQQSFCRTVDFQQQLVNSRGFKLHLRTDSSDSLTKPQSPTKQVRQVYSFPSPWYGLCSFTNSIDGRSLKCRHTLPSANSSEEDSTTTVAELRFNLPWSLRTISSDSESEDGTLPIAKLIKQRSGKELMKRQFRHLKNLSSDKSQLRQDEGSSILQGPSERQLESDMDRLSLKLGREKAGGGYKGTSAKLGKLIIEDEGLKMCDLIVAACMGVWWQHYEGKSD